MIEKLNTSRSATFYRLKKPLSKNLIQTIFKDASIYRIGNYEANIVQKDYENPIAAQVSLLIFKFDDEPSFLKDSGLKELKFAFLLLVESKDFLAVFKKHVFGLDKYLKNHCTRLQYEEVQYLFSDAHPSYEKMALSVMGISRAAILRKTLESEDLRGQVGAQASRRSIPTSTTIKTKDHRHVLRPVSSSISKTDSKSGFREMLQWIGDIAKEVTKANRKNEFLDGFAQSVEFDVIIRGGIVPNALLLNLSEIKDQLADGAELRFRGKTLSGRRLNSVINFLESTFVINHFDNNFEICYINGPNLSVVGQLRVNKNTLSVLAKGLREISLFTADGHELSLQKYTNSNQMFTVTFQSPEYIYLGRKVFKDRGLGVHCKEIQAAIQVKGFRGVLSEKGKTNVSTITKFEDSSIFSFVEQSLKRKKSVLICDDLGDEWADYLELDPATTRIT